MTLSVLSLLAPVGGVVVGMPDVPDPVFAGEMLGPGAAIEPDRDGGRITALAPIGGTLSKVHAHAFVITAPDGRAVLVHLGLETVGLDPDHFRLHLGQDQQVAQGGAVITWSPGRVAGAGLNPIVPVVALEAGRGALEPTASAGTRVVAGQELMTWR